MLKADNPHGQAPLAPEVDESKRDFLLYATSAVGVMGAALAAWPFVDSLNPAMDTLALASTEVNIGSIQAGQAVTVMWRGKPVFVRHRTAAEIEEAQKVELDALRDPETDKSRVKDGKPEWLVMVGVCTHLGCIPLGQKDGDAKGEYGGWFCPCHGSHYDTSGRIRKGPAPRNLPVPEYTFLNDTVIRIG